MCRGELLEIDPTISKLDIERWQYVKDCTNPLRDKIYGDQWDSFMKVRAAVNAVYKKRDENRWDYVSDMAFVHLDQE